MLEVRRWKTHSLISLGYRNLSAEGKGSPGSRYPSLPPLWLPPALYVLQTPSPKLPLGFTPGPHEAQCRVACRHCGCIL